MPEPIYSNDAKGSNKSRSNRPKGITIEDLKKQTALRLAQEQNDLPSQQEIYVGESGRQQQGGQNHPRVLNNNYTSYPRHVHHPQDSHSHHYKQHTLDGIPIVLLNTENEQRQVQQKRQQHNQQQHGGYLGPSSYNHINSMPLQDQNAIPPGIPDNHLMESHHTGNYTYSIGQQAMPRATRPLQPTSTVGLPPNTMYLQHQQAFTSYSPDVPPLLSTTRNNSNGSKNKLPHGLTVHELKEMTKARLQSEVTNEDSEIPRDRVSPLLDFDSRESPRDRAISHDSSLTGRIFQNHQVGPNMVQTQLQPQSQMLQSGYHPSTMLGGTTPSSFRAASARTDTWESTSVASHNSTIYSDNLGSESPSDLGSFGYSSHRNRSFAYPATQVVQSLDVANTSATSYGYKESRSISNPSPPVQASPHKGAGLIGGQSIFNAAVGVNRRRAVTLSPNTGSILEDRPFRYDDVQPGRRLEIPNFSSGIPDTRTIGLSVTPPTQNLNRGYSPILDQLGLGLDNSYFSNGTESSSVFRAVTVKNGSSLPGISQIGSREQESLHTFPPNTKDQSSVFRTPSATEPRTAAPPPGFMASTASPGSQTAFSRVGSMDGYCNTNRNSILKPSSNIFKSHLSPEETLVNDFGSVLDLSGSDRVDRERASTYTFGSNQSQGNNAHFQDSFRF